MSSDGLSSLILNLLKRNILVSCLVFVGLVFLGVGLFQISKSSKNDIEFQEGSGKGQAAATTEANIVVDVSGAVISPGVYKFKSNSRIQDALVSAGGLSGNADRDFVSKSINLASLLKDGMKIYIPKAGESIKSSSNANLTATSQTDTNLVSINNSTAEELDSLPGVGQVTAQKIIGARPYSTIEELQERKIVSSKVYNEIKDKIGL